MHPVTLITGASRGIGRGIALELAAAGTHALVINFAGNETAARECREACLAAGAPAAEICQGDISVAADRARLVGFTAERFGRLDLLVNNAGIAPSVRADLLEAGEESFDRLIAVNLKGPYFLTQAAARLMMASAPFPGAEHPRAVVNVTSISAFTASTNRGDYCVAKAGLAMMTKLYAARLAPEGIGVFEIQPGVIETDMTGGVKEKYDRLFAEGLAPINRWGQPRDVGRAVVAVARGLFPYSTGQVFNVDGGFHLRTL